MDFLFELNLMLDSMPSVSVNLDIARLAKGEIILKNHQSYQFLSIYSLLNLMAISRWKRKIDCALFFEGYPFCFFFQTKNHMARVYVCRSKTDHMLSIY